MDLAEGILQLHDMAEHVAFLHDEPLDDIMARRKRFEFRLGFRRLACRSVRPGDVVLLKRVGGEVEAACDVGEVHDAPPKVVQILFRNVDAEGSDCDPFPCCTGHSGLLSVDRTPLQ